MQPSRFNLFSGLMLCLSGTAYLLDTALDGLAPARSPGLGALVPVFGLIGFPGLILSLRSRIADGMLMATFAMSMAGLAGLVAVTFLVNRLFPHLPPQNIGQIVGAVRPEFLLIGIVFLVSGLLVALTFWQAGPMVRAGGALYAVGAIPVSFPPLMPAALVTTGGVMIGCALLLWGIGLIQRNPAAVPIAA